METIEIQQTKKNTSTNGRKNSGYYIKNTEHLYIVYSYGEHSPMYVYDYSVEMWFGNSDRAKHKTLARPDTDDMTTLPTTELLDLIAVGGYRAYCAERCGTVTNFSFARYFGVRR